MALYALGKMFKERGKMLDLPTWEYEETGRKTFEIINEILTLSENKRNTITYELLSCNSWKLNKNQNFFTSTLLSKRARNILTWKQHSPEQWNAEIKSFYLLVIQTRIFELNSEEEYA